jgi:hypothetical protein
MEELKNEMLKIWLQTGFSHKSALQKVSKESWSNFSLVQCPKVIVIEQRREEEKKIWLNEKWHLKMTNGWNMSLLFPDIVSMLHSFNYEAVILAFQCI